MQHTDSRCNSVAQHFVASIYLAGLYYCFPSERGWVTLWLASWYRSKEWYPGLLLGETFHIRFQCINKPASWNIFDCSLENISNLHIKLIPSHFICVTQAWNTKKKKKGYRSWSKSFCSRWSSCWVTVGNFIKSLIIYYNHLCYSTVN